MLNNKWRMEKDEYFMYIACTLSQQSNCCSKKVGSIVVKGNAIISSGVNGTKPNQPNCMEVHFGLLDTDEEGLFLPKENRSQHSQWSSIYEYHSEQNALDSALNNQIDITGSTMYCTHSPCIECTKRISNTGIKRLVYLNEYDKSDEVWKNILESSDITVKKMDINDHDFKFDYVR